MYIGLHVVHLVQRSINLLTFRRKSQYDCTTAWNWKNDFETLLFAKVTTKDEYKWVRCTYQLAGENRTEQLVSLSEEIQPPLMFCDLFSFIAVFVLKSEYHNKMHVSLGKFILTLSIIDIIILCKNKYMHSAAMFTDFFWPFYIHNLVLDTFSSFQQPSTLPCNRHFRSNPLWDSASKNMYIHLKQIRAIYERVQMLRHDSSSYMPCVYVWMLKEKKKSIPKL